MPQLHPKLLALMLAATALAACGSENKPADPLMDRYPALAEWRQAGSHLELSTLDTVAYAPGQPLQDQLDTLAGSHSVLLLPAGTYLLDTALLVPSGVVLAGTSPEEVELHCTLRAPFAPEPFDTPCAVEFDRVAHAGLANLTVRYTATQQPPPAQTRWSNQWSDEVFVNNPGGDSLLYVGLVGIKHSSHVLVHNCRLLQGGTDPVIVAGSGHVTLRDNLVSGSHNKGGRGNGYFNLDAGSHHILVAENTVTGLRHLAIQNGARHNVIYRNDLEVDVNFHNGDGGHNLVEGNVIRVPNWHGWHCFSAGDRRMHRPPGPGNLLFANATQYKLFIPELREQITEYGDSVVYTEATAYDTVLIKGQPMVQYRHGAVDTAAIVRQRVLYTMNHQWDEAPRVLAVDTLEVDGLY